MATKNVTIEQNNNENTMSILRRFRSRVRTSGVIKKSRSLRYHSRAKSQFNQKKSKLTMLDRQKRREQLYKLGKIGDDGMPRT